MGWSVPDSEPGGAAGQVGATATSEASEAPTDAGAAGEAGVNGLCGDVVDASATGPDCEAGATGPEAEAAGSDAVPLPGTGAADSGATGSETASESGAEVTDGGGTGAGDAGTAADAEAMSGDTAEDGSSVAGRSEVEAAEGASGQVPDAVSDSGVRSTNLAGEFWAALPQLGVPAIPAGGVAPAVPVTLTARPQTAPEAAAAAGLPAAGADAVPRWMPSLGTGALLLGVTMMRIQRRSLR